MPEQSCCFANLAPVVQTLDSAIQRISITEINYVIRWIVIYEGLNGVNR